MELLGHTIDFKQIGKFEETRFEKLYNVIFNSSDEASLEVANEIASLIKYKESIGKPCVLGLATGSSPIKVYEELVRMHREEGLSFSNVVTFNLDEYYPMNKTNIQSYYHFMHENLFNHVDILKENINIPSGSISEDELYQYCTDYEMKIMQCGGLDFQLLGIGRTGHIGFNEPGSHYNSVTRSITLDHLTRYDAANAFIGIDNVPRKAITMGVGTIMKAKRVVLMAWGENKADIIKRIIEGDVSSDYPASYLQRHKNTTVIFDSEAASCLTRVKTPWLVSSCAWDEVLKKKAVVWLSEKLNKSILKLTDRDYNDNGMSGLIIEEGSSYDLNIKIFNSLQNTITGWPGGKPNADDSKRPERETPHKKRVLIFSPHPDDDVISMGGTLDRLVSQGHEVHVAYQTSGSIAVSDEDALCFLEVMRKMQMDNDRVNNLINSIESKDDSTIDAENVRSLKRKIRETEAVAAATYLGVKEQNLHFLKLPFYETGKIKKKKLSVQDFSIVSDLIEEIRPHMIFAAGDLADPHGTHKQCLISIITAIDFLKKKPFMNDCWVWLYRGAWHEWDTHDIDMAVPMSPDQVIRKRKAIFYHQTQKDDVMFQGDDSREFWVRAEERNRSTAIKYNDLGLTEYAAIEGFKRFFF